MWRPTNAQGWLLVLAALFIVIAWPPRDDKSLALKFVNWIVDPWNKLPVLPDPLPMGLGDDPDAVNAHDSQIRQYDALYAKGGWARRRLELKVANDPFNPTTTRQLLAALALITAFVAWRLGDTRGTRR
ncbi:MAG: hypothetical protein HYS05_14690 [Acidobacteria bacterium]|nr:hypothetical protein [Acidobacteriota bacterium]